MKGQIKEMLILFLDSIRDYERESQNLIGYDERESSEFVDIFLKVNPIYTLAPSVTDEEIELYSLQNILESETIESFQNIKYWQNGAKWMRDNHLPSKGDDNIEILESIIDSLTTTRGDGDLSYSHYDVIDVFNVVKQALKEKGEKLWMIRH